MRIGEPSEKTVELFRGRGGPLVLPPGIRATKLHARNVRPEGWRVPGWPGPDKKASLQSIQTGLANSAESLPNNLQHILQKTESVTYPLQGSTQK